MNQSRVTTLALLFSSLACLPFTTHADPADPAQKINKKTEAEVVDADTFSEKLGHHIRYYKPIYFAYGKPLTKLQFSFRSELSETVPFNFAYTQVIFWELAADSKPFLDATYNPEFFYRFRTKGNHWGALDLGLWEHSSNGKGGLSSRSYDQSYLRGVYTGDFINILLSLSIKLKLIYNTDNTNSNIRRFVGPLDLDLTVGQFFDFFLDQTELILSLRPGGNFATDWSKGGYQIATTFHIEGIKINPSFYLQYYHGYAETLLNYDQSVDEFRFGLMF